MIANEIINNLLRKVEYYDVNGNSIDFTHNFKNLLNENCRKKNKEDVLIFCIGTDRSTGDCLGPMIGSFLRDKLRRFRVIGTLENPIHAMNLKHYMEAIHCMYPNHLIIAIDASIGASNLVGSVTLKEGSLCPGAGVYKDLGSIGDITITGIVSCNSNDLAGVRLAHIMKMANWISNAICITETLI